MPKKGDSKAQNEKSNAEESKAVGKTEKMKFKFMKMSLD